MTEYQLPRVWSAADSNQGKFSGINRLTAGSAFLNKPYLSEKQIYKCIRLAHQTVLK